MTDILQPTEKKHWPIQSIIGLSLLALMTLMVALSPQRLVFDETFHLPMAFRLAAGESLHDLLIKPTWSAVGPLYAIVHLIASPFTGLKLPQLRIVNLVFFVGILWALVWHLSCLGWKQPFSRATILLYVPMVWATVTIAMTEIPAMFFATLAVIATERATSQAAADAPTTNRLRLCLLGVAAGLCLALAALGRQSYLVAIPLLFMPLLSKKTIGAWPFITLPGLLALAFVAGPVFWTWGGYAPPLLRHIGGKVQGLSALHGFLGIVYLGIIIFFICPHWYLSAIKYSRRIILPTLLLSLFLGNAVASTTPYLPLRHFINQLPDWLQHFLATSLIASGVFFAVILLLGVITSLQRGEMTTLESTCLAIAILSGLSCLGMKSQFSARYLLTSFPFLLYALQPQMRIHSNVAICCGLPGALIGAVWVCREYGWF